MSAPTASPDLVAKLVLNPMRNAKEQLVFGGKTLNGVMNVYSRLGDETSASLLAVWIYELAETVQSVGALIEKLEAEAGS